MGIAKINRLQQAIIKLNSVNENAQKQLKQIQQDKKKDLIKLIKKNKALILDYKFRIQNIKKQNDG